MLSGSRYWYLYHWGQWLKHGSESPYDLIIEILGPRSLDGNHQRVRHFLWGWVASAIRSGIVMNVEHGMLEATAALGHNGMEAGFPLVLIASQFVLGRIEFCGTKEGGSLGMHCILIMDVFMRTKKYL